MTCQCQTCGRPILMDLLVDTEIWKQISPSRNEGGLLCASCICDAISVLKKDQRRWASARLIPGHI